MARIRKAIVAAVGAGISAATPVTLDALPAGLTAEEVAGIAAAFAAAAFAVGVATWKIRNDPARHAAPTHAPEAPQ